MSGYWQIVVPEETTNLVRNPSAEKTGNTTSSGATLTRVTTYGARGNYCYRVQTAIAGDYAAFTTATLANAAHYMTAVLYGDAPAGLQFGLGATYVTPTKLADFGNWRWYGASFSAGQANGQTQARIYCASGSFDTYIDCIQVEQKGYATTYVDGDQSGCYWTQASHASSSTRPAHVRSGGKVSDLEDAYGLVVAHQSGFGLPPLALNEQEYATLPGSYYSNTKVKSRQLSLVFQPQGGLGNYHTLRDRLVELFKSDLLREDQPVTLRYSGTPSWSPVEINCRYLGGLEGALSGEDGVTERAALRFSAQDPFWYSPAGQSLALAVRTAGPNTYFTKMDLEGTWSVALTPNGRTECMLVTPDGHVYLGGTFTALGDANGNRLVRYNADGTVTTFGTGVTDGGVYAMALAPNGDLYIGGTFTGVSGVANTAKIAKLTAAGSWAAVGTGMAAATGVYALCFNRLGDLYIGGNFTNIPDANGDYVCYWTGTVYGSNGGSGLITSTVYSLALGADGSLYAGTQNNGLYKSGTTGFTVITPSSGFTSLGGVNSLYVDKDGTVWMAGLFTYGAYANLASWNGSAWTWYNAPSSNLLAVNKDTRPGRGTIIVSGASAARIAALRGSALEAYTEDIGTAVTPMAVGKRYLYFGSGNTQYAGRVTVTNPGSATAYPVIVIGESSAATVNRVLYSIRNETTAKSLVSNYTLRPGETLSIDLRPGIKQAISSIHGDVTGRVLQPGGEFATWGLQPGDNVVTVLTSYGADFSTPYLSFTPTYWSVDGA